MTRVLLAEDDPAISEPLARALRREGYDVDVRADGRARSRAPTRAPTWWCSTSGCRGMDGLEVCRRIRADGSDVPVLVLTARADEVDTVVGLDAGADDYVTKPFRLAELLARVRALLRRGRQRRRRRPAPWCGSTPRPAGPSSTSEELQLTAKEFDLLRVLVREQGKVVSREQLMREVWDTAWFGSTKTLDMHISGLRRKLGDDAAQPRFIATVRGVGFRFERGDRRLTAGASASGAVHRARGGPVGHHRGPAAVPRGAWYGVADDAQVLRELAELPAALRPDPA